MNLLPNLFAAHTHAHTSTHANTLCLPYTCDTYHYMDIIENVGITLLEGLSWKPLSVTSFLGTSHLFILKYPLKESGVTNFVAV